MRTGDKKLQLLNEEGRKQEEERRQRVAIRLKKQVQEARETIEKRKTSPFIMIDSRLLKLCDLTAEAFRMYAQLKSYADNQGEAFPSYETLLGIYIGSYPDGHYCTLRKKAIAAIEELVSWNLIKKSRRYYGDTVSPANNLYTLTDPSEWFAKPKKRSIIAHKKGRIPKEKAKKASADIKQTSVATELETLATTELFVSASTELASAATEPTSVQWRTLTRSIELDPNNQIHTNLDACVREEIQNEERPLEKPNQPEEEPTHIDSFLVTDKPKIPLLTSQPTLEDKKEGAASGNDSHTQINSESSAAKCDQKFRVPSDSLLDQYRLIWNEKVPQPCVPCPKLDSQVRRLLQEVARSYSPAEFGIAVDYIRESPNAGYYRNPKDTYTLIRFLGFGNHVSKCYSLGLAEVSKKASVEQNHVDEDWRAYAMKQDEERRRQEMALQVEVKRPVPKTEAVAMLARAAQLRRKA